MDQEIEAEAREFLTFLDNCSQQSRASATSDFTLWLNNLQLFLAQIQHDIDPKAHGYVDSGIEAPVISTQPACELYPTLGVLLTRLCRNPIVLASETTVNLLTQSVLKYSGQVQKDQLPQNGKSVKEEWCINRLRDMLQISRSSHLLSTQTQFIRDVDSIAQSHSYSNNGNRGMGFFQLFEESEVDMKKARVLQIIEVLSQDLRKLNAIVLENTPLIASRRHMVSWTQHLSGLCAPLVSFSVAEKLVEGVINLSYSLKDGSKHTSQTNLSATLLDAAFVEQVLLHSNDKNQEGGIRLDDCHLIRLCIVSDIARKRYLVQLIDSIMIASAVQPGFALRRKEIFSEFVESSQFCLSLASYLNEKGIEQIDFVQSIFEDITGMAGEIEDWRFIRICVLLMDWIMVRGDWTRGNGELSSQGSKYCSLQDDAVSMSAFDTMLLHSSSLLKYYRDHVSVEIPLDELELFMQAQQDYIYCAGPKRFHLRRRLAYLMSTAIAHHEEFIVHRMYCHFVSSEQQQHDSGANHIDDNQLIRFILCLTMPDESEQSFMSILHGQFSKLLLELQILCSDYRRQESTAILLNSIGAVFEKHKTILKLNETLLANIIYAVGLFIDTRDPNIWQSMVRMTISALDNTFVHSRPLILQLQDISENAQNRGLGDIFVGSPLFNHQWI